MDSYCKHATHLSQQLKPNSDTGSTPGHEYIPRQLFVTNNTPINTTKQGYNFNTEHTILDDDGKKAGDAYVSNPYVDEPKTILDVTISCPTCPTYICNAAAASNDHCTKLAEKNKHTKYDDLASKLDCRVVAAAFTTYRGWGDDFKKTLVDPYYLLQEGVQGRSQERRVRLGRHQRPAPLRAPRLGCHLP